MANGPAPLGVADTAQIDRTYRHWRIRLIYVLIIGYAAFYLVRQNMQIAVPLMLRDFGCTRTNIGWIFSAFPLVYGIGKFVSGALCDRFNVRYYMSLGLLFAAICSVFIGLAPSMANGCGGLLGKTLSPLPLIAVFYSLNGLFQSAGWPPIARLMTNWFSPKQLGICWGIVNGSHQIGSVMILVGGAWLGQRFGWTSIFFVPAAICVAVALFLFKMLCDTPEAEGLPPLEVYEKIKPSREAAGDDGGKRVSMKEIFLKHIIPNRALWLVCWANFFLYVVRMGFFNWAPTFLQEARGSSALGSSFQSSLFELAGIFSGIFAGYVSDRWAGGRRNAVCTVFMAMLIVALLCFWLEPSGHQFLDSVLLITIGFFIYGPQTLAGIAGAEFGSGRAAATANGLTGFFGYMGAIFSGFGVGLITDNFGWNHAIFFYICCAAASLFFFMLNWSKTAQSPRHR
ncbi:MAG: MFS transporter [Puniceicoccales bacterium]|nr:MFS transporter [Puniceicoccales bacterium]